VAPLGESFDFGEAIHRDIKRPPAESSGVFYDSVRGGPHRPSHTGVGDNDSPMFVLCDLAQTRLSWSCVKRCCAASCGVLSGGIAGPRYTRNTTNGATIRVCVWVLVFKTGILCWLSHAPRFLSSLSSLPSASAGLS
jgi:hypothetical protein